MKTYLIQLEQHDDLISIRDKMSWAKSERILLVWPPRRKVKISPLDLVLLQRHAKGLGAQLGIASRAGEIRQSARVAHIPAFKTSSEAQLAIWYSEPAPGHSGRRRKHLTGYELRQLRDKVHPADAAWIKSPMVRIGFFTSGVIAVLLFFIIFLPSATITIYPKTQEQSINVPITVDPSLSGINLSGAIPGYPIRVHVQGQGQAPSTGKVASPEVRATGDVQFTNLGETAVVVPEGTVILTVSDPAVRFFVTQSGEVPAGVGKSLTLPVKAAEGGQAGNLAPNVLQAIEGNLGLSLSVTNPQATSGGEDVQKMAPTASDRNRLVKTVSDSLSRQALEQIQSQVPGSGILLAGTLAAETTNQLFQPSEGTPGPELSLDLQQDYSALYIKESDLTSLGDLVLDASLPKGFEPVKDSMQVNLIGEPVINGDGKITWEAGIVRKISARVDSMGVIIRAVGKRPDTARERLSALAVAASSEVSISPGWWPWMPLLPMRITVESGSVQ